ncbi:Fic family protein [Butyrivibrio sp. AE2032]|uniref:Fic family protein n=1 Tax=Butyrivibrio sp. AE2032 TaxID=1458463 RepID=UPI000551B033|nr:Fic family protein [Butyrivibrio sp. AE2032]
MILKSNRSGAITYQPTGYDAFCPNNLPPNPPVCIDDEMQDLLSLADRKLGRLDGITEILPNPELFVAMYVKKEAVLSSQIEGTQASLVDILNTTDESGLDKTKDSIMEVVRYVKAIYYGLDRLGSLPLSLRLIKEIHKELLTDVRGAAKNPGEFRKTQNWIGPTGCTLSTASFVPPPPSEMQKAMEALETFFYEEDHMPALIKIALIHAQFETIHPFLDGNGRMGRLLIIFWLCQKEILSQPLLYLSYYFKLHRGEYYEALNKVRFEGAWEDWIKFFLKGIAETSDEATDSAKAILALKKEYAEKLYEVDNGNSNYQRLLTLLFENPIVSKKQIAKLLNVSEPTASAICMDFCKVGILVDITPEKQRYKKYKFDKYLSILQKGTEI